MSNSLNENEEKCSECGRFIYEYSRSWPCRKNHDWRKSWRRDKNSEKYKKFLEKRNKVMKIAWRKRLNKLNKKPPIEYLSRRGSNALRELKIKRKVVQRRKRYDVE